MVFLVPQLDLQKIDFKPYIEHRLRIERRLNRDLFTPANDDRTDLFNRTRVGVDWKVGKHWSGALQYQFAHNETWRAVRISSDEASDLNLAYAKFSEPKVEVTIGRQKINIGDERLIGSLEWALTGRAVDGVRIKSGPIDAYAFKIGVAFPKPGRTRILGAAFTSKAGLTSLTFKHDDQVKPDTDHWTASHLWKLKRGKLAYEAEGAIQVGHATGKSLRAWALHTGITYACSLQTKSFVEFSVASGGGNATSTRTFDNLLPSNHKFYGSMDLMAWKNMEEIALGVSHQATSKLGLTASLRSFRLRDAADAWYGAGGAANVGPKGRFVDPTGKSGRDIGRELNVEATYKHDAHWSGAGGFGVFFPGNFVKVRNGGRADRQVWVYATVQVRF